MLVASGGNEFIANYNDFTYVDPGGKIIAQDATSVTTSLCTDKQILYGYQDLGADFIHFNASGTITIDYDFKMTGGIKNGNHYTGVGNTIAGFQTSLYWSSGAIFANWGTSVPRLLYGYRGGVFIGSSTPLGLKNTWYYGRVTLTKSTNTYKLEVFSDAARTVSLGSISNTSTAYPSDGFRYAYVIDNGRNIDAARNVSGIFANLKITW